MNAYVICLVCLIVGGVVGALIGYKLSKAVAESRKGLSQCAGELKNGYRWRLKGYFEGWDDAEKLYNKSLRSPEEHLEEMRNEQLQRDAAFFEAIF